MHIEFVKKSLKLLAAACCVIQLNAQTIISPFGSTWKYWANSGVNAPASGWKGGAVFDDSGWPSGPGRLGYGGDGEVTCLPAGPACPATCTPGACTKYTSTYFRRTVNIPDLSLFTGFLIDLIRDDGAVIYVNGQEVWRSNMVGGAIAYSVFAPTAVGGTDETTVFTSWMIPKTYFVTGNNIVAVEVHQATATSTDLGFDLKLTGTAAVFSNEVLYMWSGAITKNSAKVNAKLSSPSTQVRLVVSTSPTLSSPIYGPYSSANSANNLMASLTIAGLIKNTKYYYAIESEGVVDSSPTDIGSFTTVGPLTFKFTVGGCSLSSDHPVYTKMGQKNPLFNLMIGDFHYTNPNSGTDLDVHRLPYEQNMLSQPASRDLFLNYPLAYVWDDHDYSGNDTDSLAAGKTNARLAYREYVPYYPLGNTDPDPDRPIYQAFTIGRIHFILTDLRSTRRTPTMMGTIQKAWFKDQCLYARDNDFIIAWVSSVSFAGNDADNWGGFAAERTELGEWFKANTIKNMFIMSGDAHMCAIDNGNNHDFSIAGNNINKYPVLSAAAMNQSGSYKGGNYSEAGTVILPNGTNNSYLNPDNTFGQYGLVEITDNGGLAVGIRLTAYRVTSAGVENLLVTYQFNRAMNFTLPVKIKSFSVISNSFSGSATLHWEAEDEGDCRYIVERSLDGVNFSPLGEVQCNGQVSSSNSYSYIDTHPFQGKSFYRIKVIERTGNPIYSAIRSISIESKPLFRVSPNPAKDNIYLEINNILSAEIADYIIYDAGLKLSKGGTVAILPGTNRKPIDVSNLAPGIYLIHIVMNSKEFTARFIRQ